MDNYILRSCCCIYGWHDVSLALFSQFKFFINSRYECLLFGIRLLAKTKRNLWRVLRWILFNVHIYNGLLRGDASFQNIRLIRKDRIFIWLVEARTISHKSSDYSSLLQLSPYRVNSNIIFRTLPYWLYLFNFLLLVLIISKLSFRYLKLRIWISSSFLLFLKILAQYPLGHECLKIVDIFEFQYLWRFWILREIYFVVSSETSLLIAKHWM